MSKSHRSLPELCEFTLRDGNKYWAICRYCYLNGEKLYREFWHSKKHRNQLMFSFVNNQEEPMGCVLTGSYARQDLWSAAYASAFEEPGEATNALQEIEYIETMSILASIGD